MCSQEQNVATWILLVESLDWSFDYITVDNPRSVVRDMLSWFDLSRADPSLVTQRVPATTLPVLPDINSYAQAYSQAMMGRPALQTPEAKPGPVSPVQPVASPSQAFRAQLFSVGSDAGSEPDPKQLATTLDSFIEHTNHGFEDLQNELHRMFGEQRLKNHTLSTDMHANDILVGNLTGEHHRIMSRLDRLEATLYRKQTQDEKPITVVAGQSPARGQLVDMNKMKTDIDELKDHVKQQHVAPPGS